MPPSRSGGVVLAATAVVVLAIWLVGLFVPAHTPLDPPRWLPLPSDAGSWTQVGEREAATFDDGVRLRSSVIGTNQLYLDLPLARPPFATRAWLQLSGRVVEERREGRSWATGTIRSSFKSASGRRLDYRELRFVPRRATNGERFSTVLEWPAEAASVELSMHSQAGAPTFSLVEGSAEFVRPDPLYRVALGALAVVAAFWLWTVVRFARSRDALAALLLPGALAVAIVVGVTLSLSDLRPLMRPLLVHLENAYGIDRDVTIAVLLKGGHALGFLLLTLGLLRLRRRLGVGRAPLVAFAALIAIGSEGLQSHLANRGASVQDVLIDLGGVLAALALASVFGGTRASGRVRRRSGRRRRTRSDALDPRSFDGATAGATDDAHADARSTRRSLDTATGDSRDGARRRRKSRRSSRSAPS